jgi:hypothetical protein
VSVLVDDELVSALRAFEPISLADTNDRAANQTRVDRKYVVTSPVGVDLLRGLTSVDAPSMQVLEIDGRRQMTYRSLYLDTPDHLSYRRSAAGHRRRFKVRVREYVDSGTTMLEVKRPGRRGTIVKTRAVLDDTLDRAGFVADCLGDVDVAVALAPTIWTGYARATLVDVEAGARATVDVGLAARTLDGPWRPLTDAWVVETKSDGRATAVDRWLWAHRVRPTRVSKFGVATALHHPELGCNRWHRALGQLTRP